MLTEEQLWKKTKGGQRGADFSDPKHNPFAYRVPLWFFILKEAELTRKTGVKDSKGGHHLGPIGGRIVSKSSSASS